MNVIADASLIRLRADTNTAGEAATEPRLRSGRCDSGVLGPDVSVSMQRFIEKNKSIQETPQHPCVSVDVRNKRKKSNIDPEKAISARVDLKNGYPECKRVVYDCQHNHHNKKR